jgi:hypothetical protein
MKYIIVASLVILSINVSNAQTKLGVKINPAIITQRISFESDTWLINKGPNAFNVSATLFADIELSENYFFTLGIGYTSKRINLKTKPLNDATTYSKSYNVQYVQLPATLKMYTNEIALDKKLYFQVGPLFEIAVHNKETNKDFTIIDKFQPVDVSLLFAAGVDIRLAPQTSIMLGINYTRGLVNIVKNPAEGINRLTVKNDLYCLEMAVRF